MSTNWLTNINMNQNQLINAAIVNASTAPASPVAGQLWFNTSAGGYTANTLYYYSGSAWVEADAQQAVSLTTLQQYVQGLSWKESVVGATAAALPSCTYANGSSGSGATLTATANAALTLDTTVTVATGQRVLVKNQASAFQNGIYVVTNPGSGSVPFVLTRATDMDVAVNGSNYNQYDGATVYVQTGTVNAGTAWSSTTTGTVTVGTTNIPFTEIAGPGTITGGTGITVTGNSVAISASYAGQTSIVTVGTITAGTWTGTSIAVANGGTGAITAGGARTNLSSTALALPQQYNSGSITTTAASPYTVTHSLNNSYPEVTVYNTSGAVVYCDVAVTSANAITVTTAQVQTLYVQVVG